MADHADNGRMPLNLEYIRQRREQLGLTQQQAADAAGFPNLQKWSQYETGKIPDPQLSSLESIARALKCKVGKLLKD
jgi:transcriptional regulator with XRE-family HTH domain